MSFSSQAVLRSASELERRAANACAHDREIRFALNRLGTERNAAVSSTRKSMPVPACHPGRVSCNCEIFLKMLSLELGNKGYQPMHQQ